jgi:hypothetical protein
MTNHSDAIGMVRAASANLAKTKHGAFYDPNGNIQDAEGMLANALRLLETDQPAENDKPEAPFKPNARTDRLTKLAIVSRALLDSEAELEIAQLKRDSAWRQFMAMVDIVERTA